MREALEKLSGYSHAVVSWIGDDGYPVQTPVYFQVDVEKGDIHLKPAAIAVPADRTVNLIASHIRLQPGSGYDERRYILFWGRVSHGESGATLRPQRTWGWDEKEIPFFEYSERSNRRGLRYMEQLSRERGAPVKPRLSPLWTFLVATRLPFLTATFVPILLGIAVAARDGHFSWWLALLTLLGGAAVHIGLNVANDVFDALSGADDANVNPTQYSGGSRVIQRGLLTIKQMSLISGLAYSVGIAIGIFLVIERQSLELLAIGAAGVAISIFYTAPPFRLVHRGLGEIAVGVGFGPLMVLGAYVVQAGSVALEPVIVSIPVAILIALVLYVNEVPDRQADAAVGKRTLPVRLSERVVITAFLVAALSAFAVVGLTAAFGLIPRTTLISLLALPLVFKVYEGMRAYYSSPYELMAAMGKNVQLHLVTGLLLLAGYMAAVVIGGLFEDPPPVLI